MERLTKRDKENVAYWNGANGKSFSDNQGNIYGNAITKLADYEDTEEKGLLLRLPHGIGKPCYVLEKCQCGLHYNCRLSKKASAKAKAIVVKKMENVRTYHLCMKIFERPFKVDYLKKIGKTVFLTKEEAEQALERMEKENE